MKVGFLGLGKLGLPCALAAEFHGGHEVFGFDVNPAVADYLRQRHVPYREEGMDELLAKTHLTLCASVEELVRSVELLFVSVQTPHDPQYEGIGRLKDDHRDFDYTFLVEAMAQVNACVDRELVVSVISTVLPGTLRREVLPNLNPRIQLAYNPFFIAMGTTIHDFTHPEFVLVGTASGHATEVLRCFYGTLHKRALQVMSFESAELAKVSYNTFIGMKIVFANTLMEISEKLGADSDAVANVLGMADQRLMSPKYLRGGMGDGGGCHPRDNIAMAWLAEKLDLSYDIFTAMMSAREKQTEWMADLVEEKVKETGLPVVLCGLSFKPETNLTVGSPALLLKSILAERGIDAAVYDPVIGLGSAPTDPAIYFISTDHAQFRKTKWPPGAVVLDPWNQIGRSQGQSLSAR